jgi:hypothetical protein
LRGPQQRDGLSHLPGGRGRVHPVQEAGPVKQRHAQARGQAAPRRPPNLNNPGIAGGWWTRLTGIGAMDVSFGHTRLHQIHIHRRALGLVGRGAPVFAVGAVGPVGLARRVGRVVPPGQDCQRGAARGLHLRPEHGGLAQRNHRTAHRDTSGTVEVRSLVIGGAPRRGADHLRDQRPQPGTAGVGDPVVDPAGDGGQHRMHARGMIAPRLPGGQGRQLHQAGPVAGILVVAAGQRRESGHASHPRVTAFWIQSPIYWTGLVQL